MTQPPERVDPGPLHTDLSIRKRSPGSRPGSAQRPSTSSDGTVSKRRKAQDSTTEQVPPEDTEDCQYLLRVIFSAGGTVPECFFRTSYTWDETGEPTRVKIPIPAPVLADEGRCHAGIDHLLLQQHLIELSSCEKRERYFTVSPGAYERYCLENTTVAFQEVALAAVCRSFPRRPHLIDE